MPKNLYINNGKVGNVYWNGAKAKKVYFNNVLVYSGAFEFTYTGAYEVEGDLGGDFIIRFKTSGTLTVTDKGDASTIDVFCLGGGGAGCYYDELGYGGGGGGGGYTKTVKNLPIAVGTQIAVAVGAGGVVVNSTTLVQGGTSSILTCEATGGYGGAKAFIGGDGGSGGGGAIEDTNSGYGGGSDGRNGTGVYFGGKGQGTTTVEFGELGGVLYAGGGGGGSRYGTVDGSLGGIGGGGDGAKAGASTGIAGVANQGGGGGGNSAGHNYTRQNAVGGSGIVCIRNHRWERRK